MNSARDALKLLANANVLTQDKQLMRKKWRLETLTVKMIGIWRF